MWNEGLIKDEKHKGGPPSHDVLVETNIMYERNEIFCWPAADCGQLLTCGFYHVLGGSYFPADPAVRLDFICIYIIS